MGLPSAPTQHGGAAAVMSRKQSEQVRLLGQLVRAEGTVGALVKQETVVLREPNWKALEASGCLPPGAAAELASLHSLSSEQRSEFIEQRPQVVRHLLCTLKTEADSHATQYALTLLCEMLRENLSRYECVCGALSGEDVFGLFMNFLKRKETDSYTADRAAFLLSGIMCRSKSGTFSLENVATLADSLIGKQQRLAVSEGGRLDAFVNLLKIGNSRIMDVVNKMNSCSNLLLRNLSLSNPAGVLYKAVFCAWLLTYNAAFINPICDKGIVKAVCDVIKESRVEKVVRVSVNLIRNLLGNENAVEIVIEENVAQILTILEFEKWRDADMYDEIRLCSFALDQQIMMFNNFDRYLMELEKKELKWSVLHSEKFWRENVLCFEKDEFLCVRKIASLLEDSNSSSTTKAIACHDLGEFARLHPAGKKVCQGLRIKDKVMLLITSKDREVAGEALLCVQKLMLNNWQDVARQVDR